MRCPGCGVESADNLRFCARCGFAFAAALEPRVASPQAQSRKLPEWLLVVIVLIVVVFVIGIISLAVLSDNNSLLGLKTGKLSVTIVNYDVDDREVSIYIDGEHSTDEVIPGGFQWTGLVELRWSGADPIKEISVISAAGTQTKQVQMIEGSIASVSFEIS